MQRASGSFEPALVTRIKGNLLEAASPKDLPACVSKVVRTVRGLGLKSDRKSEAQALNPEQGTEPKSQNRMPSKVPRWMTARSEAKPQPRRARTISKPETPKPKAAYAEQQALHPQRSTTLHKLEAVNS